MDHTSLGQRVRLARKELKMTQYDLAEGIVTSSMICQIENGKAFPSYNVLSALAERLDKPIEYFVSDTDASKRQRSSYTLAKALMASGSYEKAYTLLKSLQELPLSDPEDFQITLSECCHKLGKYDEAAAPLDEMLTAAKNHGHYDQMVSILFRLGEIAESGSQFQLALYHWEKAYELLERTSIEASLRAKLLTAIGTTQYKLGNAEVATSYLHQAFEEREAFHSVEELGHLYVTMSLSSRDAGDNERAAMFSERAVTIFKSLQNIEMATEVKRMLGVLYAKQGQFALAHQLFDECLDICTRSYDALKVGLTQMEKAVTLQLEGKLDEAIPLMQNALSMLSSDELSLARAQHVLAEMYQQSRDVVNAIHHLSLAMPVYEKWGHSIALTNALHLSIDLYQAWNQMKSQTFGSLGIA